MTPRPALAVSLYLSDRRVVLVGRDDRSRDRIERLRAAGARVVAVAPDQYRKELCQGAFLVLAQSGDHAVDRQVAGDARAAGCLCYVHDRPELSDLAMPALARRGPLSLAISTDATAPALAGRLRGQVQALLDSAGQALDGLLADMAAARAAQPGPARARRLAAMAGRLRVLGRIAVDPPDTPDQQG
jgi:uroporphyrin-III C-methyltransferase / precorrin-2 dehydrogenase / sirohydrochlorin ferrochelatase